MDSVLSGDLTLPSRYSLQSQLGSGEMGAVYSALDKETGASVAIKIFKTDQQDPLATARLKRAFHAVSSIKHPNIVRMHSVYPDWQHPFFSMELLEGGDLRSRMTGAKPAEAAIRERLQTFVGILDALQAVHAAGIMHRDLKPTNILFDAAGTPRLSDFGLAGMINPAVSFTKRGAIVGTPPYMSPEQIMGKRVDHRSDFYSLGIILYEFLTGRRPFDTENAWDLVVLQTKQALQPPGEINPAVSAFLEGIVMRLLRPDPAERYETAEEIKTDLLNYLHHEEDTSVGIIPRGLARCSFLGREEELEKLEHVLEEVCKGKGGVVLVGGEAGVGKTALIEELRARAILKGVGYFKGRSIRREGVFYRPFAAIIRDFEHQTNHSPQEQEQIFGGIGKILGQIVPELSARSFLQSLPDPAALDEEGEKSRLFEAVTRFAQRLAEQEPVLFLFDDLQWADVLTFELLAYLSRNIANSNVLIAGTYRSEGVIARDGQEHPFHAFAQMLNQEGLLKQHLVLDRFDRSMTEEMVHAIARTKISGKKTITAIHNASAGNPYFIEELLQMLSKSGALDKLTARLGDIPASISELIESRLKVIDGVGERRVLKAMAVFGRAVPHHVLLALLSPMDDDLLLDVMDHLVRHRIAVELGTDLYEFAHPLMAKVLYKGLGEAEKKALHQKTALALEEISRNRPGAWSRDLIYHWEHAENLSKSLLHCLNAGLQAAEVHANSEAVTYLGRAADQWDKTDLPAEQLLQCLDVLVQCALHFQEFSKYERYMYLYEQKALETKNTEAHVRAALMVADGLAIRGRLAEATAKFESVLRIYSGSGASSHEAQRRYAYHLTQRLGRPMEALSILELLSRKTEGALRINCQMDLMRTYWKLGRLEEAKQIALSLENDPILESSAFQKSRFLNVAGIIISESGGLEEAKRYFEKKMAVDSQTGDLIGLSRALYNLAEILHEQGEWTEALGMYNTALANLHKLGNIGLVALLKENLCWLSLEMGNVANAKLLAREVHSLIQAQASNDPELVARSAIRRAHLAKLEGKTDSARIILQKALQEVEQKGQRGYFTPVAVSLAEIFMETGRIRQANDLLESCKNLEKTSGRGHWMAEVEARLAECKIKRHIPEATREMIKQANLLKDLGFHYRSAAVLKRTAKVLIDSGYPEQAQKPFLAAHEAFSDLGARQDVKDLNEWGSLKLPQTTTTDPQKEEHQRLALPPCTGREAELSDITGFIASHLVDRKGALCLIEGEPGVGTTRLTFEAVSHLEVLPAAPRIASALCRKLRQRPLAPFERAITTLLPHIPATTLAPLMGVLLRLFPGLHSRMEFQMVRPAPPLDPPLQKNRALDVLFRFFKAACEPEGLVLVFDDLGLADQTTLDAVRMILRNSTGLPLVVLANTSGQSAEPLPLHTDDPKDTYLLKLSRLTRVAITAFLQEILEPGADMKALADDFFQRTNGNPLFLKELLEYMTRHHCFKKAAGRVSVLTDAKVPDSFKDLVLARLKDISPDALPILQASAVLGREFDFEVMARIMEMDEEELLTRIAELEDSHLVLTMEYDPLGRALYRFHHPQIKETVWQETPPMTRISLHRRAGDVLEQNAVESHRENAAELAFHFEQGGDSKKAIQYGLQAARQAHELADGVEARRLLAVVERLDPDAARVPLDETSPASLLLAEQYRKAGDFRQAIAECEAALQDPENASDPVRVAELHAICAWCMTEEDEPEGALTLLETDYAGLENFPCKTQMKLLRAGQHAHQSAGRLPEALKLQADLCRRLEEAQDVTSLATQKANLCILYGSLGDLNAAASAIRSAHEIAERLDLDIRGFVGNLSCICSFLIEPDTAKRREIAARHQGFFEETTDPARQAKVFETQWQMAVSTSEWNWISQQTAPLLAKLKAANRDAAWRETADLAVWAFLAAGMQREANHLRSEMGSHGNFSQHARWSRSFGKNEAQEWVQEISTAIQDSEGWDVTVICAALLLGRSLQNTEAQPTGIQLLDLSHSALQSRGIVAYE